MDICLAARVKQPISAIPCRTLSRFVCSTQDVRAIAKGILNRLPSEEVYRGSARRSSARVRLCFGFSIY